MLFTRFKQTAEKYYNRPALNGILYNELLEIVEEGAYNPVADCGTARTIIDILIASKNGKPIIVPPLVKDNWEPAETQDGFGLYLYTSGTTGGTRRAVKLTDTMIVANADNSIALHNMTPYDIVYTVCSMRHTGGINAQTIAALLCGAHVVVEAFNPYKFFVRCSDLGATISHLTPRMIDALIGVKNQTKTRLSVITCGSDCVSRHHVEYITGMNIDFILNYGLTQGGPILINHRFTAASDLSIFDKSGVPLGTIAWCEILFIGANMYIKGPAVSGDEWLITGDCVYRHEDWYIYRGRLVDGTCKIIPKA
jgi:long-subunit acyl-CoA synthetase (AMP-forming)